ncbi:unnamed protein product [Linum tenue]|uniref:Uncharacterized protein n=1 Tax=Linum tenue TaxID=586396 RepID=A0AAV0ME73_9ROSI|nr:unnamed protein product [Linum tenue]
MTLGPSRVNKRKGDVRDQLPPTTRVTRRTQQQTEPAETNVPPRRNVEPVPRSMTNDRTIETETVEKGAPATETAPECPPHKKKCGKAKGLEVVKLTRDGSKIGGIQVAAGAKKSKFEINMTNEAMRRAVNYSLSRSFTQFKHHFHSHYQALGADNARQTPLANISMDDWLLLCEHFESPQFKEKEAATQTNKDNTGEVSDDWRMRLTN